MAVDCCTQAMRWNVGLAVMLSLLLVAPGATAGEPTEAVKETDVDHLIDPGPVIEYQAPVPEIVQHLGRVIGGYEHFLWAQYTNLRNQVGHISSACNIELPISLDGGYGKGVYPYNTSNGKTGVVRVPEDYATTGYFTGCSTDESPDP